jgi:hypothetical protein
MQGQLWAPALLVARHCGDKAFSDVSQVRLIIFLMGFTGFPAVFFYKTHLPHGFHCMSGCFIL